MHLSELRWVSARGHRLHAPVPSAKVKSEMPPAMPTYLEDLTLRLAAGIAELPEAVRRPHAGHVLAAQREDGGFAGREGGSDLYYTGFALRSLAMLGELYGAPAERAAGYLKSRLSGQE